MWLTPARLERSHVYLWIPFLLRRIITIVAFPGDESLHAVVCSSTSRKPRQGHQCPKLHSWHKRTATDWTIPLVTSSHLKGRRTKAIWHKIFKSMEEKKRYGEGNKTLKALCPDTPCSIIMNSGNDSLNYWSQDWMQGAGLEMLLAKAENIIYS